MTLLDLLVFSYRAARRQTAARVNGSGRRMPCREPKRREGPDIPWMSDPSQALAEAQHPRRESFTRSPHESESLRNTDSRARRCSKQLLDLGLARRYRIELLAHLLG